MKTAVVDDRERLTYGELDQLVTRVAAGLAARGIAAGEVVSCILPNRAEAVILFYAVNRLGAVLNPIVPIYGAREIRFILRQAESVARRRTGPLPRRRLSESPVDRVRPMCPRCARSWSSERPLLSSLSCSAVLDASSNVPLNQPTTE